MHLGHLIKQKGYEKIVFLLRRHPLILARGLLVFAILAGLPVAGYYFFEPAIAIYFENVLLKIIIILGTSIYALSIWLFVFSAFLDYYLDLWIVTNDRIMNIEQHGLFGRTVSELDLSNIQDVTSEIKGIFATIFNYGNVQVQTAGEQVHFTFEQIRNPHVVRQAILDMVEEDRRRQSAPKPEPPIMARQ